MKNLSHSRRKKQPKVKTEMTGKGHTIYGVLLPIGNFMEVLKFREKVGKEVTLDRAANAQYEMVDAIEMIVVGWMAGATAIEHMVTIWSDKVLQRISGWTAVPVPPH